MADLEADCVHNVDDTVRLLRSLGFIIHPDKSVLRPTQSIEYLGVFNIFNILTPKPWQLL